MTPRDFALIAQEAYTAKPDIGDEDSASRAIVRQTESGLVVAFPGSDNLECWLHDFDADLVNVPGIGDVHDGFWKAWKAISVDVLAAIAGRPVTLVGHSLGGAIALLAAADMSASGNFPTAVYGFEPPRVCRGLGVRALLANVPVRLYKNGNDIVPDLPPGLDHGGLLMHIGHAALPIPNTIDHELARVTAALPA
jgi:predicted lipase